MAYPEKLDAAWDGWGRNWTNQVNDINAVDFGLTADQANAATAAYNTFHDAYVAAVDPATRAAPTIQAKDDALLAFRETMKSIVATVQANTGVTNETRVELGLRVRDTTPTPAPTFKVAPQTSLLLTGTQTARATAIDPADPTRRAKPFGAGKVVFRSYMCTPGEQPPADLESWPIETISGRTTVDLYWPKLTETTDVFVTSCWMNTRGQCGPISNVAAVQLSGSLPKLASAEEDGESEMRIAA